MTFTFKRHINKTVVYKFDDDACDGLLVYVNDYIDMFNEKRINKTDLKHLIKTNFKCDLANKVITPGVTIKDIVFVMIYHLNDYTDDVFECDCLVDNDDVNEFQMR